MSETTERTALAEITRRLIREFPAATPADVDAAVSHAHARFDTSKIRDFIPLFVEKHARQTLGPTPPRHQGLTFARIAPSR